MFYLVLSIYIFFGGGGGCTFFIQDFCFVLQRCIHLAFEDVALIHSIFHISGINRKQKNILGNERYCIFYAGYIDLRLNTYMDGLRTFLLKTVICKNGFVWLSPGKET